MDELNINERIRPFLLAGERIVWSGQPQQGLALSGKDALLIPFSLLWGGFAIFWNAMVRTMHPDGPGPDLFFRLWGLPFLVAGLYIMVGRFWHDAAIRKRLVYAVTNERVLVVRGWNPAKLISLDIRRLPRLELTEHRDGSGTIAFEGGSMFSGNAMNGMGWWVPALSGSAQFFRIADPRKVYETIQTQSRT